MLQCSCRLLNELWEAIERCDVLGASGKELLHLLFPLWAMTVLPYVELVEKWVVSGGLEDRRREFCIKRYVCTGMHLGIGDGGCENNNLSGSARGIQSHPHVKSQDLLYRCNINVAYTSQARSDKLISVHFRSEVELGLSLRYWEECFSLSSDVVPTCLQPVAEKVSGGTVCMCAH